MAQTRPGVREGADFTAYLPVFWGYWPVAMCNKQSMFNKDVKLNVKGINTKDKRFNNI